MYYVVLECGVHAWFESAISHLGTRVGFHHGVLSSSRCLGPTVNQGYCVNRTKQTGIGLVGGNGDVTGSHYTCIRVSQCIFRVSESGYWRRCAPCHAHTTYNGMAFHTNHPHYTAMPHNTIHTAQTTYTTNPHQTQHTTTQTTPMQYTRTQNNPIQSSGKHNWDTTHTSQPNTITHTVALRMNMYSNTPHAHTKHTTPHTTIYNQHAVQHNSRQWKHPPS